MTYKEIYKKPFKIIDKGTGYQRDYILKRFRTPEGFIHTYYIDVGAHSVQVFALTEDLKVVCVKQFRPSLNVNMLELPGGGIDDGESLKEAAERELLEETGFKGNVEFLFDTHHSLYTEKKRHCFFAVNCKRVSNLDLDPGEHLTVHLYDLDDFRDILRNKRIFGVDLAYRALDALDLL